MNKNHNTNINNNATWKRNTNNDLHSIWHKLDKLHISGGSGSGGDACCPQTNEILNNIETNINSVIETCNDIIITSNTQIQRPVSAQNSGLYCDLIGCGCESATGSNDLDYIGQINLVSGTTVEFNSVSPDGEPVDTWELKILDLSNNVQTTFSGTNIDYNNPLGSFDLGGIGIGFYYDFVVNYVSGLASQSKGYFKINQDTTTVEHRYAILNTLFDNCENIVLHQNIKLNNPDVNTSTKGDGITFNETDSFLLNSFNVYQNATTPDIYLDPVLVPFNASGTKTISITFTFQDGITAGKGIAGTKWAKWAICNGNLTNGVDDMRLKNLRGFDYADGAGNDVAGFHAGSDTVSLDITNIPPHRHTGVAAITEDSSEAVSLFSDANNLAGITKMNREGREGAQYGSGSDQQEATVYYNSGDGTDNINDQDELQSTPDPVDVTNAYVTVIVVQKIA